MSGSVVGNEGRSYESVGRHLFYPLRRSGDNIILFGRHELCGKSLGICLLTSIAAPSPRHPPDPQSFSTARNSDRLSPSSAARARTQLETCIPCGGENSLAGSHTVFAQHDIRTGQTQPIPHDNVTSPYLDVLRAPQLHDTCSFGTRPHTNFDVAMDLMALSWQLSLQASRIAQNEVFRNTGFGDPRRKTTDC